MNPGPYIEEGFLLCFLGNDLDCLRWEVGLAHLVRGVDLGGVRDSRIGIVAHLLVKVVPLHVGVVREQILGG